MAAPLDIDCHSCRSKKGVACRTAEGSPTDPHAVRVALSVACEVARCRARVGTPCPSAPGGALYHAERHYKARGITGPNFRRELQRHLEQLATFLRGCPAEVSEAYVSVKVRGEANLPRLFGDSGPPIVASHGGTVDVYVEVAKAEAHCPRRPDPRPAGGGGLHRDDARPGRRRPAASYTAEFYEDEERQLEPPDEEDGDQALPALPPGPPEPGAILLGPSSLPRELPAAPARLALPPPGQQPLLLSLKR